MHVHVYELSVLRITEGAFAMFVLIARAARKAMGGCMPVLVPPIVMVYGGGCAMVGVSGVLVPSC